MNSQEAKKLENEILKILKTQLKKDDIVVIGVSGGADSTFLLYLAAHLPIKIIVAHLNHKLRKESDKDEKFVQKTVKNINDKAELIFYSKTANISSLSQKNKTGIEETGRKIRYRFFHQLAKKHQAKFILTAHHADDNLETVLLNITRGAGLQGLSGMQILDPPLFRPLLDISKTKITAWLKFKKIAFREDKSNLNTIYKRNHLRHKVIPELQKINPNLSETIAKNSKNLREINDFLIQKATKWLKTQKQTHIDAKKFRQLPPPLQKIVLIELHKNLIGHSKNLETPHIEEILKIIHQNIGNKKKQLGNLSISLNRNIISIEKITKKVQY